jgi:hypothetical protein
MNFIVAVMRYAFFRFTFGLIFFSYASAATLAAPDFVNGDWFMQSRLWPYAIWKLALMAALGSGLLAWAYTAIRPHTDAPRCSK